MADFNVGDRVMYFGVNHALHGKIGIVEKTSRYFRVCLVQFAGRNPMWYEFSGLKKLLSSKLIERGNRGKPL